MGITVFFITGSLLSLQTSMVYLERILFKPRSSYTLKTVLVTTIPAPLFLTELFRSKPCLQISVKTIVFDRNLENMASLGRHLRATCLTSENCFDQSVRTCRKKRYAVFGGDVLFVFICIRRKMERTVSVSHRAASKNSYLHLFRRIFFHKMLFF